MVRFVLGPARADAATITLPFSTMQRDRPYAKLSVGGREIGLRFELNHELSVLNAPAARIVAPVLGGTKTGPTQIEPIMYGIARVIRRLETRQPLMIGPHPIPTLHVRVDDYGRADKLRSLTAGEGAADDIVAVARRKPPGEVRLLRVGRDALGGCSSITVDIRRDRFTIVC